MPDTLTVPGEVDQDIRAIVDDEVLGLVATLPSVVWDAHLIVDMLDRSLMEVMLALARLSHAGLIQRVAPGRYRHTDSPADAVGRQLRRAVLGVE